MRLVTDTIEFGAKHTPKFNPISISGYHIREAGSTAIQELAFTLRDGIEYVEMWLRARLGRGRFRAAAFVFFQRAQRFLRGDRQIPRRAAHLVARDARALWREEPAFVGAALSRADGRMLAHGAAAVQQRRAHGRCRRWRRCWAARSPCTRIRSTRPGRCPPSLRQRLRCARSRFWRTRAA